MANEVIERATPAAEARAQLEQMQSQFHAALPAHIPVERFMRVVMTALQGNPDLLRMERKSLFGAAMRAAQDGLLPDGREAALVPFKGVVQYLPMVAGVRKKVRNSGEISTWDVHAVHENDAFEYELGDEPFIRHKPNLSNRGKLIAVYSVARMKDGAVSRDVMSVEEVEKIRGKSLAKNSGPWADPAFYPEMAKKTVAKRHAKVLPMSTDLDDLLRRDDALYDFAGAREEAKTAPGKMSLAERMAALAAPPPEAHAEADPREPAAPDEPAGTLAGNDAPQDSPGPARSGAQPTSDVASDATALDLARERGRAAARKGVTRRAVPGDYRDHPDLAAAWCAGWDEAKGDAQ